MLAVLALACSLLQSGVPARPLGSGLTLAGRVLDPEGAPVFPFTVSALPENVTLASGDDALTAWFGGAYGERVTTDREGRFALGELPPGRYAVVGAFGATPPERLSSALFAPGQGEITLEVRVHRLVVRVLDHEQHLLDPYADDELLRERKCGDPVLHCAPLGRRESEEPLDAPGVRTFAADGAIVALAEPGDDLLVGYASKTVPLVERTVRVPDWPWCVRAELRLPPPVAPAQLRLRVHGDLGASKRLALLSASGIDVTPTVRFSRDAFGASVPPGTYRVRVVPTNDFWCWQGDPEELVPDFAPAEQLVELSSGRVTEVEFSMRGNARVRIALAGERSGGDIKALLRQHNDWRAPLAEAVGAAKVELRPAAGGSALWPTFSVAMPEVGERDRYCVPWIAPGRECISISGIPPGAYRMIVTCADGRTLEQPAVLEERRTVDLAVGP